MAEAIAAFSLAANIVQFIDFGCKFSSKVLRIYRSGRDGAGEAFDLQTTTLDLQRVLHGLEYPSETSDDVPESERSLRDLAEQCQTVAQAVLKSLNKVSLADKRRKRDAVKVAIKMIWQEEEIQSLQGRLDGFKNQLTLNLLASVRDASRKSLGQQEMVLTQLGAVHQGNKKLEGMLEGVLDEVKTRNEVIGLSVLEFLTSNVSSIERTDWKNDFVTAIYRDDDERIAGDTSTPSITEKRQRSLQSSFIARLHYPGMEDRQARIVSAYDRTFHWIFEEEGPHGKRWSNFKEWLESDSQLYWITGKAGSGKSTLMKFICFEDSNAIPPRLSNTIKPAYSGKRQTEDDLQFQDIVMSFSQKSRCGKHLKKWAKDSKLITATFFFWNSGIELQMSKSGLLRSLLFQILRQCPELIPVISPSRWEAMCLFNEDSREWTKIELEKTLRRAVENVAKKAKICLFVDGLDEFDGSHDDLIALFRDLISSQNVKLCVSSRPWVSFEDEFKHSPSLMLQDLTYPDIKHYVTSNLQKDSGFAQLRRREAKYAAELVENIITKASGVFLWVHLVVASLIAGMSHGDRVSDLQRRLDFLPPDLETLYEKILDSLNPFYLEHAAQLFQLVQVSVDPPPLLVLFHADEAPSDVEPNQPILAMSPDEMSLREETMRRRLNSRCKGLLEVGSSSKSLAFYGEDTVQYLHRTVKDFVESEAVQDRLQSSLKTSFDPHFRLCVGTLAYLRALKPRRFSHPARAPWSYYYILDELDKVGTLLVESRSDDSFYTSSKPANTPCQWVSYHPLLDDPEISRGFGGTFLSLVIRYGIVDYVEARVNQECLQQSPVSGWSLLLDATYFNSRWQTECHDAVPSLDMVKCLLNRGANPNHVTTLALGGGDLSPWFQTLAYALQNFDGIKINPPWATVIRLMIEHGAKVDKDLLWPIVMRNGKRIPKDWRKVDEFSPGWRELLLLNAFQGMKPATAASEGGWTSWLPWAKAP